MLAYVENHLYAGNYYSAFPSEHCGYATILAIATWLSGPEAVVALIRGDRRATRPPNSPRAACRRFLHKL